MLSFKWTMWQLDLCFSSVDYLLLYKTLLPDQEIDYFPRLFWLLASIAYFVVFLQPSFINVVKFSYLKAVRWVCLSTSHTIPAFPRYFQYSVVILDGPPAFLMFISFKASLTSVAVISSTGPSTLSSLSKDSLSFSIGWHKSFATNTFYCKYTENTLNSMNIFNRFTIVQRMRCVKVLFNKSSSPLQYFFQPLWSCFHCCTHHIHGNLVHSRWSDRFSASTVECGFLQTFLSKTEHHRSPLDSNQGSKKAILP